MKLGSISALTRDDVCLAWSRTGVSCPSNHTGAWEVFKAAAVGVTTPVWIVLAASRKSPRAAPSRAHLAAGAIEPVLAAVREFTEAHACCYCNTERTNRMLKLVDLRLNCCDDPVRHTAGIRAHLDTIGGQRSRQGLVPGPQGIYGL
jgi:hypothetical protein